jgi:hypothetical protein
MRGRSLVSELGGADLPEVPVILDLPATSDGGRRRAVVKGNRKVIAVEKDVFLKVFDLAADPGEESAIPTKDPRFAEGRALYKEAVSVIEDRAPTKCHDACLNGGYLKGHMPGK